MALTALEKTEILIEALPYIKKFYGKRVVLKYGGAAMQNCQLKQAVMQDAVLMRYVGMYPVLVHGGGPEITAWLKRLGHEARFVNGQRVTDEAAMTVVEMVLSGKINKEIVAMLGSLGGQAVGLSGKDGRLLEAEKKQELLDGQPVDLGFVGQVTKVNPEIIETVLAQGYIPVVAPIGVGPDGESYNINADYAAAALAMALNADKLVLLTDVPGIFADTNDSQSLMSAIETSQVDELISQGIISGGMIPKIKCGAAAVEAGVSRTHIIDGRLPHSTLLEIFTDQGIGTMVVK